MQAHYGDPPYVSSLFHSRSFLATSAIFLSRDTDPMYLHVCVCKCVDAVEEDQTAENETAEVGVAK